MARSIAEHRVRSMAAAANLARKAHGELVTVRSLTRRYRERRRELEVAAMLEIVRVTQRVSVVDGQEPPLHPPDERIQPEVEEPPRRCRLDGRPLQPVQDALGDPHETPAMKAGVVSSIWGIGELLAA